MTRNQIKALFRSTVLSDEDFSRLTIIRDHAKSLATAITELAPPSPFQDEAIHKIYEAVLCARTSMELRLK